MKLPLSFIVLFLGFFYSYSQSYIFGKVVSEDATELQNVLIVNMATNEFFQTDQEGNFMIKAQLNEEIRFVKSMYERVQIKVINEHFRIPMKVSLKYTPQIIEEVVIGFVPSGNLKKDVKVLEIPQKVKKLNDEMRKYAKSPKNYVEPKLSTPSSFQNGPNFSAGQVNVFALLNLIIKQTEPKRTTPNYSEQKAFYERVKSNINMEKYEKLGIDEFEFELLLVYADKKYNLCKTYRNNFNILTIENYIKMSVKEFLDTRISVPSSSKIENG